MNYKQYVEFKPFSTQVITPLNTKTTYIRTIYNVRLCKISEFELNSGISIYNMDILTNVIKTKPNVIISTLITDSGAVSWYMPEYGYHRIILVTDQFTKKMECHVE